MEKVPLPEGAVPASAPQQNGHSSSSSEHPPYPEAHHNSPPYPEAQQQSTPYPNISSEMQQAPPQAAPAVPSSSANPVGPYAEPPPSYQQAMNLPHAAPGHPAYQPQTNPAYPKPNMGGPPYAPPPPPGYPPPPGGQYGSYPQNPLPMPQPAYQVNATPLPQPATTTVVVSVSPMLACAYCGGEMIKETDMCCLLCLVCLAIFTFPLGLPFLCCIPCTVRRRCSNCNRIG